MLQNRDRSNTYITRDSLVYKVDALYIPEDLALRLELIRMYYDDLLAGYFIVNKMLNLLYRKY